MTPTTPTTPDRSAAAGAVTAQAVASFEGAANPRLREVLQALVRHLHAFAVETSLTEEEWFAGIRFLTEAGQACTDVRQELILLSDTLGLSMVVDAVNHPTEGPATESTVLGPFYVADSPWREMGDSIAGRDADGEPAVVSGRVLDPQGRPVGDAVLDVWQNAASGLYAVQDGTQPQGNLRGRFRTGPDGRYWFRSVRPTDYSIPADGPVGAMLRAAGRHSWRPAHLHLIVSAPGYRPVTTHLFDDGSRYLGSDAVFGVKPSLVCHFEAHDAATGPGAPEGVQGRWYSLERDLVLAPGGG